MLKLCRFNPIPGEGAGGIFTSPFQIFVIKSEPQSQTILTFNFYGQLKLDIRSLRYVSRCFVAIFTYFSKNYLKIRQKTTCTFT